MLMEMLPKRETDSKLFLRACEMDEGIFREIRRCWSCRHVKEWLTEKSFWRQSGQDAGGRRFSLPFFDFQPLWVIASSLCTYYSRLNKWKWSKSIPPNYTDNMFEWPQWMYRNAVRFTYRYTLLLRNKFATRRKNVYPQFWR